MNHQNGYSSNLTSDTLAGATTTPLNSIPTIDAPFTLALDCANANGHYEIVTVTSKTATNVNHSATSYAHTTAEEVRMVVGASELDAMSPIGSVITFAGSTAPTGWLLADGSAVSRTTYSALFAVLSTTYGVGDGSTTFNVPNLKGKVVVGVDASQTEFDALGETGGEKTHLLTGAESGEKGHNHTQNAHTHPVPGFLGDYAGGQDFQDGRSGLYKQIRNATDSTTATNIAVSASNASSAHNNLQPYICMSYIIKY